jgi:hypothetical protein
MHNALSLVGKLLLVFRPSSGTGAATNPLKESFQSIGERRMVFGAKATARFS